MTENVFLTLSLAFVLGFGLSKLLHWVMRGAQRTRVAVVLLLPPFVLLCVFLVFTKGVPFSDEWIWMGIGIVYFAPWYTAWVAGWLAEWLLRKYLSRSASGETE